MMRILSICHAVITFALSIMVLLLFHQDRASRSSSDVVRSRRFEIVDQVGKVRAILDSNQQNSGAPELMLLDDKGQQALLMTVNSLGYATLYFQSKRTEGRVSVGYLWGSDSLPPNSEDPLATWGMRVRGSDGMIRDVSLPENSPVGQPTMGQRFAPAK